MLTIWLVGSDLNRRSTDRVVERINHREIPCTSYQYVLTKRLLRRSSEHPCTDRFRCKNQPCIQLCYKMNKLRVNRKLPCTCYIHCAGPCWTTMYLRKIHLLRVSRGQTCTDCIILYGSLCAKNTWTTTEQQGQQCTCGYYISVGNMNSIRIRSDLPDVCYAAILHIFPAM